MRKYSHFITPNQNAKKLTTILTKMELSADRLSKIAEQMTIHAKAYLDGQ